MELINADTGLTICLVEPIYGAGGTNGNKDDIHDEEGYVVGLPPCIWGSAEEGLEKPPRLSLNSNLTAIKKSNSTYFHCKCARLASWPLADALGAVDLFTL